MAKHTGKVAWFSNAQGYVFLSAEGLKDVFCYRSSIQEDAYQSLIQGEPVEFDLDHSPEGSQAVNVRRLGWTGSPIW